MQVAQGGTYSEVFGPIVDGAGALVTDAVSASDLSIVALVDSADADQSSGATLTYAGGGLYRLTKAISSTAALGGWGVSLLWDNGTDPAQSIGGGFQVVTSAQFDPAAALEGAEITVVSPISLTGDISVIAGDAASIPWTSSEWDDLTGATVTFQAHKLLTDTAVFASAKAVTKTSVGGASQTVTLALLGTDTDDFTPGIAYRYEVNSTAGTLASGSLSAREG